MMRDARLAQVLGGKEENYLLPFYWQHGTHRDRIPAQVQRIWESGCRALCVESRPHLDFCGPDWWADMDIILAECEKRDMKVWVLDDKRFPTGYANGLIGKKYPHLRQWNLAERHVDVMGPMEGASFLMHPDSPAEPLVAVLAYPRTGHDEDIRSAPIDLTAQVKDGYVYWDVPRGCYRVFFLYRNQRCGRGDYMDMISAESCHALIEAVYEPHYEHYARYFGKTFVGFFSDEPCFGNGACGSMRMDYGFYEHRVGDPALALPFNDQVLALMSEEMGEDARLYLGELWYVSEHSSKTRLAYMNAVTHLWRTCFSEQVGNWCREHGLLYIGHIIEDMNAHARLSCSGGHYFRALQGQDMSGIDIVLHQVMPGMAHYMHNCSSSGNMVDPAFFHYVLGQLAASMAHQYPQMKGRAMCEEFGAYGWAEGSTLMKWITDFLLVRGVNHFVPHAFSPDYPDPDCPPHFGAEGHDPQFDGFTHLMRYTNRAAHLLYGGEHITSCAILYHAEGEWMNRRGDAMLTQVPAKALLDAHLCYDIMCLDVLERATAAQGKLCANGEHYGALVVPYAPVLPDAVRKAVKRLCDAGVPVLLCEGRPDGMDGEVVAVEQLAARVCELGLADLYVDGDCPLLRHYHVRRDGADVFMFFNEDNAHTARVTVTLPVSGDFARLFLLEDAAYANTTADGKIAVELLPGQSEILVFGGEAADLPLWHAPTKRTPLAPTYQIELADSEDLTAFYAYKTTDKLVSMTAASEKPAFSGKMRYTFTMQVGQNYANATLDLGRVGQTAKVWVNGAYAGIRIAAPYTFRVADLLQEGENTVTVEVANTLVGKTRDGFSHNMAIAPSGLLGPVSLWTNE